MSIQQIKWSKEFEIGVEDIDLQHHYFLNLINRIIREIHKGENIEYIQDLIIELNKYVSFHFNSEETMMLHSNYPAYELHKQHHFELIEKLNIKEFSVLQNIDDESKRDSIITFLIDWFVAHTSGEDRKLAQYLIANGYCEK
jgi:hemerythrin